MYDKRNSSVYDMLRVSLPVGVLFGWDEEQGLAILPSLKPSLNQSPSAIVRVVCFMLWGFGVSACVSKKPDGKLHVGTPTTTSVSPNTSVLASSDDSQLFLRGH